MKKYFVVIFLMSTELLFGQKSIRLLNNVPESFKKTYFEQKHNYNPLHVGDIWQYYFIDYSKESSEYFYTRIVQDSIINEKRYFKKITWLNKFIHNDSLYLWERNDSLSGCTYTVDINDYNNDGNRHEEFLVDSLDAGFSSRYQSYKFFYKAWGYPVVTALIQDTGWVEVWGDTVQYKAVEYLDAFITEVIADKYGVISFWMESPASYLTGAIINGKQYGNIVSVKKEIVTSPEDFRLEQNYPNPFNPSTTIEYGLPVGSNITLKIFNILGEEVKKLAEGYQQKGRHRIIFNAGSLPSGVYFYTLYTNTKIITKQMLLLK